MRSLADRSAIERGLRLASFVLLALLAWVLKAGHRPPAHVVAEGARLRPALLGWSREASAESLHVDVDVAPAAIERDWLAALGSAGSAVTWSGTPIPSAIEVLPVADPSGGLVVLAAAPSGASATLADSLGVIDSA